jgi:chromosome transmission fidelity protein 18
MEEEFCPSKMKSLTLVKKYEPQGYLDLIGDEVINRGLLKWLKSWEIPIFGNKKYKAKTRELEPWKKKYGSNRKSIFKYSAYWKTKKLLEDTQLNIKDECEKLKNKIPLIVGESGCCKSTLARVIAKHCKYEPVVVNLSTINNWEDLKKILDNETMSYNIASMSRTML